MFGRSFSVDRYPVEILKEPAEKIPGKSFFGAGATIAVVRKISIVLFKTKMEKKKQQTLSVVL